MYLKYITYVKLVLALFRDTKSTARAPFRPVRATKTHSPADPFEMGERF